MTKTPYSERFDQLTLMHHTRAILAQYSNADQFRDLLIDPDSTYDDATDDHCDIILTPSAFAECADALRFALDPQNHLIELITELALSLSLCPLHRIDYAICFDDENAECAQIRMIHPTHDT